MRRSLLFAAVFLLPAPALHADAPAKGDLDKMQGDWVVASMEEHGKKYTDAEVAKFAVTIKGDKFIATEGPGKTTTYTIKLKPGSRPAAIDLVPDDPNVKTTVIGIYELGDGTLKIAGQEDDRKARPTEYAVAEGITLVVLKRKK